MNLQTLDAGVTGKAMPPRECAPSQTSLVNSINYVNAYPVNFDRMKRSRAQSAGNFKPFDTIGDQYWVPVQDHKYRINSTNKIEEYYSKNSIASQTYIDQVIVRAKSTVAPNKYAKQVDWRKKSQSQLSGVMPKARKLTMTAEIIELGKTHKNRPGPATYKQWIKPKTKGFYANTDRKCSIMASIAYDKKTIPAPNVYKGRGKDMYEVC